MNALSIFGSSSVDDETFATPWPGLFADVESASGHVALVDEFFDVSPLARFRILQQWVAALASHKDLALIEMFREFAAALPDATIVEQIDAFRRNCIEQGVLCPSNLAVVLQRY